MAMRRFYKNASIQQVPDGWAVLLDDKPIKTPASKPLNLPTRKLAEAIASEWDDQRDVINPDSMPFMQFAATAIDHVPLKRQDMLERMLAYSGTDLLCHIVEEPVRLRALQDQHFKPVLVWLHRRYDIDLHTTTGLLAVEQPAILNDRLHQIITSMNDWELIGLQMATLACGSIVLALALHEKELSAEQCFEAAEVESTYQIEAWGMDEEIAIRRKNVRKELQAVESWFGLLVQ